MVASWPGNAPVGSGATAAPARNPPMNTAAYSSELAAQIAMLCFGRTPSRCSEAATRSAMASSWAQVTLRSPCTSARWPGRAAAWRRTRSAMAWNGGGGRGGLLHGVIAFCPTRRSWYCG